MIFYIAMHTFKVRDRTANDSEKREAEERSCIFFFFLITSIGAPLCLAVAVDILLLLL